MDSAINYFSMGFDACAIIICAVIMANYYSVRRIHTRTEKLFQALMWTLLASAATNLVYVVLAYVGGISVGLFYFVVMVMVIAVHSVGIVFMLYVVSECYENRAFPKSFVAASVAIIAVTGVSIAIYCFRDLLPEGATDTVILCMFIEHYIALAVAAAYVFINRCVLTARRQVNIFVFIAFNVAATVVQTFTQAQVTAFALAVAVMLIYATLRNPKDEIDGITQLFNYQAFKDFVRLQIASRRSFWLFITGIRNINAINALWGQGSDEVIKATAARLNDITDKTTYVYRTGEARFAVVFNTREQYEQFYGRYISAISENYLIGSVSVPVDNVAVLICFPDVATKFSDIENILKFYREKISGKGAVIEATREAVESVERREQVDYAIQKAIKQRSFQVCYQPIYDLKNKKFNCCEALVRLKDDELGFIPPDEFIPISEKNGTIVEVGRQVVTEVCKFIMQYKPQDYGVQFIDVNLSVIQCLQPDVIEDIQRILKEYGVPRGMVNLEITETASAKSYALLQQRLNELHSNGFTISLDDFGTGFSSVEFLINFPFDIVKLDRSLVWAYMKTHKYEPILQHYMPMLHSLGTKIVAEGVETEEMVKALDALGCDYLQGYYYSRPLPKEDYVKFLEVNNCPRNGGRSLLIS